MQDIYYEYNLKLTEGCELYDAEPFSTSMENISEIIVSSHKFSSYQECCQNALDLITTLANFLEQVTEQEFVVMSRINPLHEPPVKPIDVVEDDWSETTVQRMYAASAEDLKQHNKLTFTISVDVGISKLNMDMVHARASSFVQ